ncbi:MAG: sulfoxide reductase heme-binding subunit YedZ [Rhizobiaceae bacterium]|nr:sulfoxide reductase heme-binding subunit YedZ [Rhizobiaceae bacterium]
MSFRRRDLVAIRASKLPWNDRSGRFSLTKALSLALTLAPAIYLGTLAVKGMIGGASSALGPRPITEAIHFTGDWAIRFLVASLAVTPLRRILNYPKLIQIRRQLGLASLFYALGHFCLYVADQKFDLMRVLSEIVLRYYLTIGFVALAGLVSLGFTSTDAMIRRMGKAWVRLHKGVYLIGVLAALHFFMQTKADVYQPTLISGLFIYLMIWRIAHAQGFNSTSLRVLLSLSVLAAALTAITEYAWYSLATNIPADRVLLANLSFSNSIRPAWWVLSVGLVLAAISKARNGGKRGAAGKSRCITKSGERYSLAS